MNNSQVNFIRVIHAPVLARLVFIGLIIFCQVLFVSAVADDSKDSSDDDESQGVLSGVGSLVDDTHGRVSDSFSSFIVQIDDFIGSGDSVENINKSWVRIRLDTVQPGGEEIKVKPKAKLRIVLPQSQQRFRLLLSTDDDDDARASNSDAMQREQIAAEESNDVALALRFVRSAQKQFRLNYDIGARYKDDRAQVFGRLNVAYRKDARFGFTNEYSNSLTIFSASGYENRFRIESRRLFFDRESLFFRNSLDFSWREGIKGAGIGETLGFYADLGKRKALAIEGITGYSTALNEDATDRFLGVEFRLRFRHSVWRPWFYYEIWPSVSWSSSNDYEQAFGGLVRFEVTLGQI